MEKIAQKVLENEIYNYFKTNIPELEKQIGEPVDEYEDFDWYESQDADFVEMTMLLGEIADGLVVQVFQNAFETENQRRLEEILDVVEDFKAEYCECGKKYYSQSIWSMFADELFAFCDMKLDKKAFEYIFTNFSEDLKDEYTLWKTDYEKWQERN